MEKSGLKVLPKKRDLENTENYCGISLNTTVSKMYILIQRTRYHKNHFYGMNQNDCCANRSTQDVRLNPSIY